MITREMPSFKVKFFHLLQFFHFQDQTSFFLQLSLTSFVPASWTFKIGNLVTPHLYLPYYRYNKLLLGNIHPAELFESNESSCTVKYLKCLLWYIPCILGPIHHFYNDGWGWRYDTNLLLIVNCIKRCKSVVSYPH